jgi:predicted nucleic acid-binding protein
LKIVCNTSPLILLAKIDRLDILIRLYREPMIPTAVEDELSEKPGQENDQVKAFLKEGKLQLRRVSEKILARIPVDLGRGEREAIALALGVKADLVILDDQGGRLVARDKGLSVTGTIGVLIEAKERGFIPFLRPEIDRLIEARMWVSEVFYHRILKEYGE